MAGHRLGAAALAAIIAIGGCAEPRPPNASQSPLNPPGREFQVPQPVTPLPTPVFTERAKIELGKTFFNDPRLSGDSTVSCASCHDLRNGGDDGRRISIGIGDRQGSVNTPSVLNSALNFAQFWDGRARTLEEQIAMTVEAPAEMDGDWEQITVRFRGDRAIAERFRHVYADGVTRAGIVDALATYVRALITVGSPLDRYLEGDQEALGEEAKAGYQAFLQLGCVSCHQGRGLGGNLFQRFGVMGDYFANRTDLTVADLGRYNVTGRESDRHKFKVPSLRNVADTAPYFHDGSAATLTGAVTIMVQYQLGRPATDEQIAALVAFLQSLSAGVDGSLL